MPQTNVLQKNVNIRLKMESDLDPEFSHNLRKIYFFQTWGPREPKEDPRLPKESLRAPKGAQKGGKEHQKGTKSDAKLYEKAKNNKRESKVMPTV